MCNPQAQEQFSGDPEKMSGEVVASRGPTETIAGVVTQSYTYVWKAEGMIIKTRLFVATTDGLPRRSQIIADDGSVVMK